MPHEIAKEISVPQLHFKPEGYVSTDDEEFLEQFLEFIKSHGFDSDELVFSGFEGEDIVKGEPVPKKKQIFVMNEAAWRDAARSHGHESTPSSYADGFKAPCVGLYDKNELVHVYSHDIGVDLENYQADTEVEVKELGPPLKDIESPEEIKEVIVHKDYPEGSPTDALVGLVFIERE